MTTPREFLQAAIPTPFTVLGLPLRPLSIGHILTMQWQGLAFASDTDGMATLDDLISGCLICSRRFREYQEFLKAPDLAARLKRLGKNLDLATVPEKMDLFIRYVAEGTEAPEVDAPSHLTGGLLMGSPWLQCLRVCLMHNFHVSAEDTWDYPYRLALWDCFSLRESQGRLTINGGQADTAEMQEKIATLQEMNLKFIERLAAIPGGFNGA